MIELFLCFLSFPVQFTLNYHYQCFIVSKGKTSLFTRTFQKNKINLTRPHFNVTHESCMHESPKNLLLMCSTVFVVFPQSSHKIFFLNDTIIALMDN